VLIGGARNKAPVALRLAIFIMLLLRAVDFSGAIMHNFRPLPPDEIQIAADLINGINGALLLLTAVGMMYRVSIWRIIAAWGIGSGCGYSLAEVVAMYWPLGSNAWDWALGEELIVLAISGFLLWAVTNRSVQLYFRGTSELVAARFERLKSAALAIPSQP